MIRPRIAFTIILYKSVPVTEKGPRRSETGIKDGCEEMEHEFPFVRPEEQDYLSDVPLLPDIFRWDNPKSRVPFTFQTDVSETFCKF